MDIEKEIKELLYANKVDKKLDDIKSLLVKKDLEQYSSSGSFGFWIFALLALMGYGGFGGTMPNITNIYTDSNNTEDKK